MIEKVKNIIITFLLINILFFSYTYATNEDLEKETVVQQIADSGSTGGEIGWGITLLRPTPSPDDDQIKDLGNNIIQILLTVASIISVIVLIVIGIRYMFGSIEEKAEYKKTLLPYVIGATLAFASSVIAGIIYNLALNL